MGGTKEGVVGHPVRAIAESGILVALAVVLAQFQLFPLPQGGSVTPGACLPIWIVAWRHGVRRGVLAGVALGTVLALLAPAHWHVLQVLLDYPLAFGMLGLAGAVRGWLPGALLASVARIACHAAAGILFFREFVPAGWVGWKWAIAYNALVVLPDAVVGAVIWVVLRKRLEGLDGQGR